MTKIMSEKAQVSELLLQWEEAAEVGKTLTPEYLCRDNPDLLPKLKKHIAVLQQMNPVLKMEQPATIALGPKGAEATVDIGAILRHRLRIAGSIFILGCIVSMVLSFLDEVYRAGMGWVDILPMYGLLAVAVILVLPLFTKWRLTLAQLRTLEVLIFAAGVAMIACVQYRLIQTDWLHDIPHEGHERKFSLILIDSMCIPWMALIVLYGTFIPNTWRRCAIVVGLIWLAPVLLVLIFGWQDEIIGPYLFRDTMLGVGLWLAFAAAIAIWGSHKISVLQKEASEARKLGQYRLTKKIGAGGMGEVYLAEHDLLRRPCAVKLIHPERAGDRRLLKRFEREVRSMATLTHWNTVEVFDYGHAEDGTFYYVMEYLPGMTLEDMVQKHGPLPPARAVHFLRQICCALREAHAIGLIHRDIKPSNIIICERGGVFDVAKLLDFGLVKTAEESLGSGRLTQDGVVAGTPLYMSPEQASDSHGLDLRSDLASLGSVAYFLLTGQPPFVRESIMQLFAAHMRDDVKPLREAKTDVPADLEAVVMRCLEKEPDKRFPDARSLEIALAECECAGEWTQEEAEKWWGKFSAGNGVKASQS